MLTLLSEHPFPADARPACVGKHELFDANDEDSHLEAKALCGTCPVALQCASLLTTIETPTGTWAGKLQSGYGRPSNQLEREEAMFNEEDARLAYNAWYRGERTPHNRIGARVHKRRLDRKREAGPSARTATERRYDEEDAMFTDAEAREGATAYRMGDKSERNRIAQRVWKRRQREARRLRDAA